MLTSDISSMSKDEYVEREHLIHELEEDERPRERLIKLGRTVLSDTELLAILIGSGMRSKSALSLSRELLLKSGGLRELARWSIDDICGIAGVGQAKAIRIQSAFELGRRFPLESTKKLPLIRHSRDAYEHFAPVLSDLMHEEFWVAYLSNAHRILCKERLAQGGMTSTVTDMRILFRKALSVHATSVVLAHNHPSGNLKPSESDLKLTKRAVEAGRIMDIHILDHIILSPNDYVSFADNDWFEI